MSILPSLGFSHGIDSQRPVRQLIFCGMWRRKLWASGLVRVFPPETAPGVWVFKAQLQSPDLLFSRSQGGRLMAGKREGSVYLHTTRLRKGVVRARGHDGLTKVQTSPPPQASKNNGLGYGGIFSAKAILPCSHGSPMRLPARVARLRPGRQGIEPTKDNKVMEPT